MKQKVTAVHRLKWQQLGHAMHFVGRNRCTFNLATMLERKVIVSTIGEYRPKLHEGNLEMLELNGATSEDNRLFYETYVFTVAGFTDEDIPMIGKQLEGQYCEDLKDAYKTHKEMCEKYQLELNMGAHR